MSSQALFENLKRIDSAIATQFCPPCEVVVHDLSHLENSIAFIAGEMTGRQVGGPVTDFVLGLLNQDKSLEDLVAYMGETKDGKAWTSSTVFLKHRREPPISVSSINFDVTHLISGRPAAHSPIGVPSRTITWSSTVMAGDHKMPSICMEACGPPAKNAAGSNTEVHRAQHTVVVGELTGDIATLRV